MTSKVNQNFPIPGIDQSSRGFRDNFAIIKQELEALQNKNIQVTGAFTSTPISIGYGTGDVVIPITMSITNVPAAGSNLSVQYNNSGNLAGSSMTYDPTSGNVNVAGSMVITGKITPVSIPTVSGSRGGNTALQSLITALATLGLINDSTTV
jgi:hypothetical protein